MAENKIGQPLSSDPDGVEEANGAPIWGTSLRQDTGAGDSFAGGFISGMLDDRLNSDIAEPIQLGVLAAKGRMRSFDYENPYLNIQKLTDAFFEAL